MIPSYNTCDHRTSKRALETCDLHNERMSPSTSTMGMRHLSKSASELSCSPREPLPEPEARPRSAAAVPRGGSGRGSSHGAGSSSGGASASGSHFTVYQKAHTFFSQIKSRWSHGKRERRHKSPGRQDSNTTDYAADLSCSDHSTPSTQSPRHRLHHTTVTDSPLTRAQAASADTPHSSPSASPKPRPPTPSNVAGLDLIPLTSTDNVARRREAALRQHSFFQLRIYLRRGQGLAAMDKNGTSDPYVKFKCGGRLMYKSRTVYRDLNPTWDESFTFPIEDPFVPIQIKVFDYDWGLQDDFMGSATIDLTTFDLSRPTDLVLALQDPARPTAQLGELTLNVTLFPKTQEDKEQFFQKNSKISDVNKRLKSQIWSSVVTIVLVEGKNLLACDPETGTSDPYVKFRLGNEKYKSRIIWRSLNPRWLEQFDLHLYDDGDQTLELTVWDKDRSRDDFIGRTVLDLSQLERETTHSITLELEEGTGLIQLLLTISGTTSSETISDLTNYEENVKERQLTEERYHWHRTFHSLKDVGHLTVKVFKATGLAAADIGGKSDPFCVLELGNARLQTQTEYKTLSPSWQKIFTFNVKDINNVLEVTVYDEDRDHKVEFLGKIAIPLLRIRNGEKRWYALKDKKLRARAKGNSPQILLEMIMHWNPIRACIRTLNPREEKFMQVEIKFKRQVFVKNVLRLKSIAMHFYEYGKIIQSCFEWESTVQSFIALLFWLVICYYFEPWMLPSLGLLVFLKQYAVRKLTGPSTVAWDELADSDGEDEDDEDKDKEEKKSLKERLQAIQEVTQGVQNMIGRIATLGESVKNTFNFTVPYLSWIAVGLLLGAVFVLYFIPIRYLLMLWGANKFCRRIMRPNSVPNNELLDLISRVPDDEMLLDYRDLRIGGAGAGGSGTGADPDRKRGTPGGSTEPRRKHKVS